MADNDEQPETAASTPSSSAANQPQLKAAKDRNCPFCGQAFTSSSLGRHLDLYIKPKNPKPADGVHDVDKIREMRGGITRRQPRGSAKGGGHGEGSVPPSHTGSHGKSARMSMGAEDGGGGRQAHYTQSPVAASPVQSRYEGQPPPQQQPKNFQINAPSWQSTGVINDIPPRAPSRSHAQTPTTASGSGQAQRIQEMRRDTTSGQRIQRPDYDSDQMIKLQEQAEVGRAAEMALREVLGSVQAARRKVEPGPLYPDFDFFALPFPGLCLAILPAPSTLFSPAPFPSAESWSLTPPGQKQFEVLNRYLGERIRAARLEMDPNDDPNNPQNPNIVPSDSVCFKHHSHLQGAYENWKLMSDKDKSSAWTIQVLRAYSTLQTQNAKLKSDLEAQKQHSAHLEAQYERLSRCQLPREWLLKPPTTLPLSPAVASTLNSTTTTDYDADALISKWQSSVRAVARPHHNKPPTAPNYADAIFARDRNPSGSYKLQPNIRDNFIANGAVFGVGGPMARSSDAFGNSADGGGAVVEYETPPEPGAILEETPRTVNTDGDEDGEFEEEEEDTALVNLAEKSAYYRRPLRVSGDFVQSPQKPDYHRRIVAAGQDERGGINGNGKRPSLEPGGRASKGARILRERGGGGGYGDE